jgi:hypothetical protein
MSTPAFSIPAAIRDRISAPAQPSVWTPEDFADLGPRTAVDQALHRLVASRNLRRIARGFYDTPQDNRLTGKPTYPNPRDVIDALARKGKVRVVVDGLTAANDLGLTDAVPARIGVLTDGRLRPITRAGQRSDRVGSARQTSSISFNLAPRQGTGTDRETSSTGLGTIAAKSPSCEPVTLH